MSFDLAIWADLGPFEGLDPDAAYSLVVEAMEDDETLALPVALVVQDLIDALLARWPALGTPGDEDSPWAMGPEIGDAFSVCLYLTMTYSGARTAVPVIADEARRRGLVCYDPQGERVL